MFIVENYTVAVWFCSVTMICWGSWANTQKLAAKNWRFELFYWDYVIGIFLFALLMGLTLGSNGTYGRSFLQDLGQSDIYNLISAFTGGIIFNAANILLCAAIAIAGMSVAIPVGIGLALVIGVIVNYIQAPIGNVVLLFLGVAFVVAAIILNAGAYKKMISGQGKFNSKGLILSIISGALMGFFYRFVAVSMFPDFKEPLPGFLSPYSAVFIFSTGILVSNLLFNSILMKYPFAGSPVSYAAYFKGSIRDHITGVIGGIVWCLGMAFSIIASGVAGPAISYGLGQGATLIAALWGIYIWKEFRSAPKGTFKLLRIMLILFGVGLALIIVSR